MPATKPQNEVSKGSASNNGSGADWFFLTLPTKSKLYYSFDRSKELKKQKKKLNKVEKDSS